MRFTESVPDGATLAPSGTALIVRANGLLENIAYLFAAKAAQTIVAFTVGVMVARHLGPTSYGIMSYAISFAAMFGGIVGLGLDSAVIRDLVTNEAERDRLMGTACALKLAGAFVALLLIVSTSALINSDPSTNVMVLVVAAGVLLQPLGVIDSYFQARVQSKYAVIAQLGSNLISAVVRVILVLMGAPLFAFVVLLLVEMVITASAYVAVYVWQQGTLRRWRYSAPLARRLVKDSWPLALSGVLTSVYLNFDQVLVNNLLGAHDMGNYAVALRFSTLWFFAPVAIGQSFYPLLVAARTVSAGEYRQKFQRLNDILIWGALGIVLPTTVLAEWLVRVLFGASYAGAAPALAVHIWSLVALFPGVACSNWLIIEGAQRLYPIRLVVCFLASIALNLVLIPQWGITGAATAFCLSQLTSTTIFFMFTRRMRILPQMQLRALLLPLRVLRRMYATYTGRC